MRVAYVCEYCGESFASKEMCIIHEKECQGESVIFICDKCGRRECVMLYGVEYDMTMGRYHDITFGEMGYGSIFDGSTIKFTICDDCLADFLEEFKNKNIILSR